MNLVAKEFIASRVDNDGVLVLSEFAGAAVELADAVITNPFSNRAMDLTIISALAMPEPERQMRMKNLRAAVQKTDVRKWTPGTLELKQKTVMVTAA